jgi:hypothetical protein
MGGANSWTCARIVKQGRAKNKNSGKVCARKKAPKIKIRGKKKKKWTSIKIEKTSASFLFSAQMSDNEYDESKNDDWHNNLHWGLRFGLADKQPLRGAEECVKCGRVRGENHKYLNTCHDCFKYVSLFFFFICVNLLN